MNHETVIPTSPAGPLRIAVDDEGRLTKLEFIRDGQHSGEKDEATAAVEAELNDYFAGKRTTFNVETAPKGTPFQKSVWKLLREIPYGETRSYGQLAAELGNPGASRAVGRANATNPIAIVVPCHRVIGSNGTLTGFAGGLDVKAKLLALERGDLSELF